MLKMNRCLCECVCNFLHFIWFYFLVLLFRPVKLIARRWNSKGACNLIWALFCSNENNILLILQSLCIFCVEFQLVSVKLNRILIGFYSKEMYDFKKKIILANILQMFHSNAILFFSLIYLLLDLKTKRYDIKIVYLNYLFFNSNNCFPIFRIF